RRRGERRRTRTLRRHAARRHPARERGGGAGVPRRHELLGARAARRDRARGHRDRRSGGAAREDAARGGGGDGLVRRSEWILAGALTAEIAFFAAIAPHFLTIANGFEVLRASVELGLLAIALTPVIVS